MYCICITSISESQISVLFGLWTAFFKLQAILMKVHRMTLKLPYKVICTLYCKVNNVCEGFDDFCDHIKIAKNPTNIIQVPR